MENDIQQGVFSRLSRVNHSSLNRTVEVQQPVRIARDERIGQLRDEFDMVDQRSRGSLDRESILRYLQQKYQLVNFAVLDNLLDSMEWIEGEVTKDEFCSRYLRRQLHLAGSINRKQLFGKLNEVNRDILRQFAGGRSYVLLSINRVELDDRRANRSWQTIILQFDDAENMNEPHRVTLMHHDPAEESVSVLLPCQHDSRLLLQVHIQSEPSNTPKARAFINISSTQLRPNDETLLREELILANKKVGELVVGVKYLPILSETEAKLNQLEQNQPLIERSLEQEKLQLEYLQFLWGGLPSASLKVPPHKVGFVTFLRWAFIVLLAAGASLNHLGGRFDPLSFLLAFSMLTVLFLSIQLIKRVWLKLDQIQFICIASISLFADVGWLALSQFEHPHILITNSLRLNMLAVTTTLLLLPLKLLFLMYLLIQERNI